MESHTCVAPWGEFGPTPKGVLYLIAMPLNEEVKAIGLTFEGEVRISYSG